MYSPEAIQSLVDRIGWSKPLESTVFELSEQNLKSESGRFFDSFHKLVTVTNVYDVLPTPDMDGTCFNEEIYKYKQQAVLKVLNAIFDTNERAYFQTNSNDLRIDVSGTDYSAKIIARASVFDEAYGYQMAVDVLELELSSARSNRNERQMKEYQMIPQELEGYFDPNTGKMIVRGVRGKLKDAIVKAIDILFPQEVAKSKNRIIDRSYLW